MGVCMKSRIHTIQNCLPIFVSSSSTFNTSQEGILTLLKTKKVCLESTIIFCLTFFLQIILMAIAINEWLNTLRTLTDFTAVAPHKPHYSYCIQVSISQLYLSRLSAGIHPYFPSPSRM